MSDYFSAPGLRVRQPLGEFIVTVIPAETLLNVAYSHRLKAIKQPDGTYKLVGSQRELDTERLETEIAPYICRVDAAFPNSVILAANFAPPSDLADTQKSAVMDEDDEADVKINPLHWSFDESDGPAGVGILHIPTDAKLAAVIDGQHRIAGLEYFKGEDFDINVSQIHTCRIRITSSASGAGLNECKPLIIFQ